MALSNCPTDRSPTIEELAEAKFAEGERMLQEYKNKTGNMDEATAAKSEAELRVRLHEQDELIRLREETARLHYELEEARHAVRALSRMLWGPK